MRNRLIELLTTDVECTKDVHGDCSMCKYQYADDKCAKYLSEIIADFFLANGGILLPCKVGDTVYVDSDTWGFDYLYFDSKFIYSKHFLVGEIVSIIKTKKQLLMKIRVSNSIHTRYKHKRYTVNALGVTVFLTEEEAERASKEREGK